MQDDCFDMYELRETTRFWKYLVILHGQFWSSDFNIIVRCHRTIAVSVTFTAVFNHRCIINWCHHEVRWQKWQYPVDVVGNVSLGLCTVFPSTAVNASTVGSNNCIFTVIANLQKKHLSVALKLHWVFAHDRIYAVARICHVNSVCSSVCHTGGSVKSVWS